MVSLFIFAFLIERRGPSCRCGLVGFISITHRATRRSIDRSGALQSPSRGDPDGPIDGR